MLVHKGGKIKNWGGECRDVTPTKSLSQVFEKILKKKKNFFWGVGGGGVGFGLGGGGGGQGGCERRIEVFVKIQKKLGGGGGSGGWVGGGSGCGGVRVDVNEELKFYVKK